MSVILERGDLVLMAKQRRVNVLVHGCNCFHKMGAGIAKQIAREFPFAYKADLKTLYGAREKLGGYSSASENGLTIVNAYTQFNYGRGLQVDYDAVARAMKAIASHFSADDYRIGMPKIGTGLAGGDWVRILGIIEEAFTDKDVMVVEYQA